jgi:uncharacterized SAM-binding protein YcdF (DUF218 family)
MTRGRRRLATFLAALPRVWRWAVAVTCGLLLVTGLSFRFLVFPDSDPAGPTDAVVLLAGAPETRLPVAVELARTGPGVLVISAAGGEVNGPSSSLCDSPPDDVVVQCFTPEAPRNTRAEARAIGALVAERGWTRITVVTSSYHMARAGLLVRRCTDAEVLMVEARPVISGLRWAKYVTVELGGLAVAAVSPSC